MAVIEYFYSAHSAFAYLGSACLMRIAKTAQRQIVHKPCDLHQAMIAGGAAPFARRSRAHTDGLALAAIAQSVQLEPQPLLEAALTPGVRARYLSNTQEAAQRSVFGSPTYFVDGDPGNRGNIQGPVTKAQSCPLLCCDRQV